jgi:adenosylcobinamide-GDP ribazoletransferase
MDLPTSVRLSLGTVTVLPTGPVRDITPATARNAMMLAPVAVLPVSVATAGVALVSDVLAAPDLVTGLLAVGVLALGTRALHLDGLADTADGLGSGWNRARALEVMRRGDVGPMGVVTLMVMLGLQAAAIGALADDVIGAGRLALLVCVSRAALVMACLAHVPAARADGLGAAVAGSVAPWSATAVWGVAALLLAAADVVAGTGWLAAVAGTLLAVGAVAALLHRCVRRLGGVTGDVMGACVEVAFTALLVGSVLRWPA